MPVDIEFLPGQDRLAGQFVFLLGIRQLGLQVVTLAETGAIFQPVGNLGLFARFDSVGFRIGESCLSGNVVPETSRERWSAETDTDPVVVGIGFIRPAKVVRHVPDLAAEHTASLFGRNIDNRRLSVAVLRVHSAGHNLRTGRTEVTDIHRSAAERIIDRNAVDLNLNLAATSASDVHFVALFDDAGFQRDRFKHVIDGHLFDLVLIHTLAVVGGGDFNHGPLAGNLDDLGFQNDGFFQLEDQLHRGPARHGDLRFLSRLITHHHGFDGVRSGRDSTDRELAIFQRHGSHGCSHDDDVGEG